MGQENIEKETFFREREIQRFLLEEGLSSEGSKPEDTASTSTQPLSPLTAKSPSLIVVPSSTVPKPSLSQGATSTVPTLFCNEPQPVLDTESEGELHDDDVPILIPQVSLLQPDQLEEQYVLLSDFYTAVNHNWIQKAKERRNLTTLSVAGGFRDYQVRSGLAFLPRSRHQYHALSVVSSSVPRVWASTDHLSIVWCKELILATVRTFFDLIDENTKQITEDPQKRMLVLKHHFLKHPAKLFEERPELITELAGLNILLIPLQSRLIVKADDLDLTNQMENTSLLPYQATENHTVMSTVKTVCWFRLEFIGVLHAQLTPIPPTPEIFSKGLGTPQTYLRPSGQVGDRTITLKLQDYPSLSHLVLHVPAVNGNKFTLDCEFFNEPSRTFQLPVTHLFTLGKFIFIFDKHEKWLSSSKIALNSIGFFYTIQLQHFGQTHQAFKILIESRCQSVKERKPSMYRLHIPWSHEDSLTLSQIPSSTEISAKLHIAQPENDTTVPVLNIYSSSDCQYEVTIKTSFLQVLGQVIRFHGGALPVYIISNILLAYGRQLRSLIATGKCLDFIPALTKAAKPYKVEPIVNIVKFLLGLNWLKGIWDILFLPEPDTVTLSHQNVWFPLISLGLFMFGTAIAYWSSILFSSSLRLLSSLHLALTRPSGLPSDNSLITRRRLCAAASMIILSWTTCGSLAIMMTYFHYIFKIIKLHSIARTELSVLNMPSNSVEQNSNYSKKEIGKSCGSTDKLSESSASTTAVDNLIDSLKMHVTILNLLTWIVLLCCPSLIYWLKNLRYHIRLDPDPCRFLAFILITVLGLLMHNNTSKLKSSQLLKIAVHLPLLFSVAVVAFAPKHLYRAPYIIIIPLFLHALCHTV
ncbi:hypothetical protein JD844_023114 [Phrynosoma platyrhinos]|uniref:GPI inositol-deacylase n=1 Tax=Phrynosoma platyrhinos TaxID=52577 RepID=A0ABQ7SX31_PHRPL|nr:hypothetical protein JD844_023114 [Phrynosoma platyrhinos]